MDNEYPKRFMTITELTELGHSRKALEDWVHARDFPCYRNNEKGMFKIDTLKLDAWLIKKGLKKRTSL